MLRKLGPFFDLLAVRVGQALVGDFLRTARTKHVRLSYPTVANWRGGARRKIFVDVSVISRNDAGTGIQRVVRALALGLLRLPQVDWDIHFVAADRRNSYRMIAWPPQETSIEHREMRGRSGDVFLGLDFSLDSVRHHRRQLASFRRNGGSIWFLMHDLLPLDRPDWFSANNVLRFKAWLDVLAGIATGFLCNSEQTKLDLRRALGLRYGLQDGYQAKTIPMSHGIMESVHFVDAEKYVTDPIRIDISLPYFLMVGTLEPRKGHADVLWAFTELWNRGDAHRLVIVGRMGWKTEALRDAIRNHPEHGRKLIWLDDAGDEELDGIYRSCEGVIVGSLAEGFGLPLIEALGHGKPVLARDLPVFRIHEHLGVRYFPIDADKNALANALSAWASEIRAGRVTVNRPVGDWKDSAKAVLIAIC